MLIGIVMTPYYIKHLGSESYGLVAFFTMLTTWMNLLDLGISPTLGREVASARGIQNGMSDFRKLLRSFEMIFLIISFIVSTSFFLFRDFISTEWIKAVEISHDVLVQCVMIIGVLISLRWFSSLYKSLLTGLEEHFMLNLINIFFSTLKFIGALFIFKYISSEISVFFVFQLILGFFEFFCLIFFSYRMLPYMEPKLPLFSFYVSNVKNVLPFALGIAYTSMIWMFVSQVDKLILSGVLSLKEFGYFNLVVVISSTITALASPINQAILPRMVYLNSINKFDDMISLYRNATQLVALISLSLSITIALFSKQLVYAWTENIQAAVWCENVLFYYALGSGVLSLLSFQYYLQVAVGKLDLHVKGGTLSLFIDVPILVVVAFNFGAETLGLVWFILRLLWFLLWTPLVHSRFTPGEHFNWLFFNVLIIILPMFLTGVFLKSYFSIEEFDRLEIFLQLVIIGLMVFSSGALFSSFFRGVILNELKLKF
jgi:O-antigen/teichoic acid export membrane protein